MNAEEARQDTRFKAGAIAEDAKVKITQMDDRFPFFGIPNNGCSAGDRVCLHRGDVRMTPKRVAKA